MPSIVNIVNGLATGPTFEIPLHDFAMILGKSQIETFSLIGGCFAYWDCLERHFVGEQYVKLMADMAADANVTLHMVRAAGTSVFRTPAVAQNAKKTNTAKR